MLLQIAPTIGDALTVIDETNSTPWRLMPATDWGNSIWDTVFTGPRGTQGARLAGATPQNRPVVLALRTYGTSKDDLNDNISTLSEVSSRLRRFGGRITIRLGGQSYRQHFDVQAGSAKVTEWGKRAETNFIAGTLFEAIAAPFLIGDPYDVTDDFTTDTITAGDWTRDAGAAGDYAITGGQVTPNAANLSTERRLTHTVRGHDVLGDQATTQAVVGATLNGFKAGNALRRQPADATTYLDVYVDDDGTNSRLRIDKVIAGSRGNLASVNLAARITTGQTIWVRARTEGNVVYAEHFTSRPTPMGSPTNSTSVTLTSAEQAALAAGYAGVVWIPKASDARLESWTREPFTRRNAQLPEYLPIEADIPGDAPALCDLLVTPSGGSSAPIWAAIGFSDRPLPANLVTNGDFEANVSGWQVAAVTGVQANAGTSISRDTTAGRQKYGTASAQIVTPASSGAGAAFPIYRRFRRGQTYTATIYALAPSSTTQMVLKLGVNGDVATSTATALTSSLQQWTVTWTPSADREVAYLSFQTNAATATTCNIDAAVVYDGSSAPSFGRHAEGAGAPAPFDILAAAGDDPTDRTTWTVSATGSARLGAMLLDSSATGAKTYTASWWVDPGLLLPDDYTMGEIDIEVWAVMQLDAGNVSPKAVLSARPEQGTAFGAERFTGEYGTTGKLLTKPSSSTARRPVRLGTITLPVDAARPARWKLYLAASIAAGSTGTFGLDHLIAIPVRGRAAQITAKAGDGNYPKFVSSTAETSKRITSDLRGYVAKPGTPEVADHGLGQALLELPAPDADLLVKLSSVVPDDPTSDTSTEQLAHAATVHAALTPRWSMFRGTA